MSIDTPPRGIEDVPDPDRYWDPDPQPRHRKPGDQHDNRGGLVALACMAVLVLLGGIGVIAWRYSDTEPTEPAQTSEVRTSMAPIAPVPVAPPVPEPTRADVPELSPTNTTIVDGSNLEAGEQFQPGTYVASSPTPACRWQVVGPDSDVEQQGKGVGAQKTKRIASGRWFTSNGCGDWTRVKS